MHETNKTMRNMLYSVIDADRDAFIAFSTSTSKTKKKVLGVRVPNMRKIAKELARDVELEDVLAIIDGCDRDVFEEVFVCGLIITYSRLSDAEKISAYRVFLDCVDSWALIDSAAVPSKTTKIDAQLWEAFVSECLKSKKEFVVRFGVVFMLVFFLNKEKLEWVFKTVRKIKHEGYYVKVAVSWLYAEAAVNFFDETLKELNRPDIDGMIRNKACQKVLESFRLSDEKKSVMRKLRSSSS